MAAVAAQVPDLTVLSEALWRRYAPAAVRCQSATASIISPESKIKQRRKHEGEASASIGRLTAFHGQMGMFVRGR